MSDLPCASDAALADRIATLAAETGLSEREVCHRLAWLGVDDVEQCGTAVLFGESAQPDTQSDE